MVWEMRILFDLGFWISDFGFAVATLVKAGEAS